MSIIEFNRSAENNEDAFDLSLDTMPDVDEMDVPALYAFKAKIQAAIDELNEEEPKDEESEEYELWSEQHEDLEDILDDIIDRLDDLGENV